MKKCSVCKMEFTKYDKILFCHEHEEYFHGSVGIEPHVCESEHSQKKHGAYYHEAALIDGKVELI